MNLPKVFIDLLADRTVLIAQRMHTVSETAIVLDEGQKHTGKAAMKKWIEKANQVYNTTMKPLCYSATKKNIRS